jgi:hypothetical protein
MCLEGDDRARFQDTLSEFAQNNWRKLWKSCAKKAGNPVEIRTEQL